MHSLIEMLKYRRPQGSKTQHAFCQRYLFPLFGEPDRHGNYVLIVGDSPNICFTAHHDTVHNKPGFQIVSVSGDIVTTQDKDSNCLGADCTTGVWLILGMIESNVPGVYVVHASEESGCIGSQGLVKDSPLWLESIQAVISFDRRGKDSIVTHQMGGRTCSDGFANSLAGILGLDMFPDNTGVYTDSDSYSYKVPECTNVSVGYLSQHSKQESQDLAFADLLLDSLICADWSKIVIERDPNTCETWDSWETTKTGYGVDDRDEIERLCYDYPEAIAGILESFGLSADDIRDELGLNFERYAR